MRLQPEGAQFSEVFAVGAGHQGGYLRNAGSAATPPVIWTGTNTSWTALASSSGDVFGIWGGIQVGDLGGQAALWLGTPQSRVDLEPPGGLFSQALAVRGTMQVGIVDFDFTTNNHAALWRGTAASYVDLHPTGAVRSFAYATDGVLQGGSVEWQSGAPYARLWSGSAQVFVDLSLAGLFSEVYGMAPGVQVGYVFSTGSVFHAAVWHGTAQSFTNFNGPMGATRLHSTTGRFHVGQGGISGPAHALINFGTPNSWLDLHQFLSAGYTSFSHANAVYQDGPAIYVGGYAYNAQAAKEAFLWIGADPCYGNCDQSTASPTLNVLDFVCFLNAFAAAEGYANCDGSTTPPVLNVLDFVCFINRFAAGCS